MTSVIASTHQLVGSTERKYWSINNISEVLKDKRTKRFINYAGNGVASGLNLIAGANRVFNFSDSIQEGFEKITGIWTKFATASQGFIAMIDLWQKKNTIPLIGNALEIPIAIFSSIENLWLFRGISQGLGQFYRIIDQREIILNDGKPALNENDKPWIICGNFKKRGFPKSFWITLREIPRLISESFKDFKNLKKLPHALTLASVTQIAGGSIALTGWHNFGALIRDIAGIGVDFALIRDKNLENKFDKSKSSIEWKGLELTSPFVQAGLVWMGAAVADYAKRISFIDEKIPGLNFFSYFFDRGASVRYVEGILGEGEVPDAEADEVISIYDQLLK